MEQGATGLRKRQQITRASRMMFVWVAGASAVVGFSLVVAIFLFQRISYGEKVIGEKAKTEQVLKANLEVVGELRENIRVLDTNEGLRATRLSDQDLAIQSILDALPADANSTALGASLQRKLLSGVDGVTLESIRVDPVVGVEMSAELADVSSPTADSGNSIGFNFTVSANNRNAEALREILRTIERSIRPITLTTLQVEGQGNRLVMTASGYANYEPARSVELTTKVVNP